MKQYLVYVCEKCGYESRNRDNMEEHEASHLGLTAEEMRKYKTLNSFSQYMGWKVSSENSNRTRAEFDEAIENLVRFEEEHGMV